MANTLCRYFIVISGLWHIFKCFWCNSFKLDSNSQISTFWGHASLILQNSCIRPLNVAKALSVGNLWLTNKLRLQFGVEDTGNITKEQSLANILHLFFSSFFCPFVDTSAGTGKLCILGHLGLVFIWSCFVSCLLFLLFYVSLRNLCSGTCRKIPFCSLMIVLRQLCLLHQVRAQATLVCQSVNQSN